MDQGNRLRRLVQDSQEMLACKLEPCYICGLDQRLVSLCYPCDAAEAASVAFEAESVVDGMSAERVETDDPVTVVEAE